MTRVLVIDDEPQIRRALATNLRARDYDVELAATGEEGLRLAAERRPDLVLLDIGLPDIEGFDVARELAVDGPPPHVVLTSSREASTYGPRLTTSHALGFIAKDELSGAAVRALVDRA
jgi:two-component system KDP operon response regulator KdpE